MLVLTRKIGERIVVDGNIVITVADVKGENIRLAIEAPKAIKIYRGEIYDTIVAENIKAAACPASDGIQLLNEILIKKEKPL